MISKLPFAPLATLLRLVIRNGVSPRRLHILALMAFRYALFEPIRLAERLWLDRTLDTFVLKEDPIFVIGHWRSGTSHLQKLLSQDPRFTTSTLYRSLFGDISGVSESWLKPVLNVTARWLRIPFSLQRVPLDLDLPADGDIGLCCQLSPCSYTWGHIFPRHFSTWLDRWVLQLDPQRADEWLSAYDRFIRKVAFADAGRRVVMKSPGDTARIGLLAKRYPNARFVYIHRDPIEVFHSNRYFWRVIRSEYSLHTVTDDDVDAMIMQTYPELIESYLKQRDRIAPDRLVEVSYADLRDDPESVMAHIYASVDLGQMPEAMVEGFANLPKYRQQTYDTSPELERRLRAHWSLGFAWPARDEERPMSG